MTIYTTIDDYIAQVVRPSLGEYADDYDVRAIAQEMTEWQDHDNATFNGFVEREDVDFWDIAVKHETN